MSAPRQPAKSGMTPSERAVIARWDAGESIEKISASGAESRKKVSCVVSMYGQSEYEGNQFDRMVRKGSAKLQAAIAATGRFYS
ncbi:hypothetical protein [Sphingomonas sp. ERG5]|uniref:hypothetical protein n=1 Tax=Sphingomonas sp. ERG5 TaxID=1381597 RepID=UPI00054C33C3|nr:hypothetical protein [Sphingomonas sp. ERG5]